jgi:uncharacterized protein involved in exopolysaccharide biosynthesis
MSSENESQQVQIPPEAAVSDHTETEAVASSAGAVESQWLTTLKLLWGRRRLIVRATLLGMILSTAIAFLIPKEYESQTQLMPPDNQSTSGISLLTGLSARPLSGLGGLAGDLLGVKTSGALFEGILRSKTVQERLVNRFDLRKVYGVKLMVLAENKLGEQSAIYEDRKSGIITIVVADRNPERAAGLARAYVEELDRLVSQLSTSSAHRERVFLEERLKTVKQDLDLASERFGQFASKNTAIDIQAQGRAMVEAAAELQGKLIAAQSELQMLRQIYTNENVRVRATQAEIGELQKELEKMGQGEPNKKLTNTTEAADPLYPSIRDLPLLGITYTDLLRRAKIEETVYEVLTQQYELAKVEEAKETPTVKVLDAAEVPEKKSFPPRMAILVYGTLLSLGSVAICILAGAHWERTNPQDPRKAFAAEVFRTVQAEMPWAANGTASGSRMQRIWRRWGRKAGPRAGTE